MSSLLPFDSTTIDALVRFGNVLNTRLNRNSCDFEIPRGDYGLRLEQNVVDDNTFDVFVPYVHKITGRRHEFRYPASQNLRAHEDALWDFLNDVVLNDLDEYVRFMLPFSSDLCELLPNITLAMSVEEGNMIELAVTRYGKKKDPTEKTFKCPFKSPSSIVKSIIAFATSKKKSERRRTASHTERGVINRYSNGIGVASSSIGRKSGSSSQQSVPSRTIAKKSCR